MIKKDGTNPKIWRGLARSLESAGDLATAEKCHRKADSLSGISTPETAQQETTPPQPVEPSCSNHKSKKIYSQHKTLRKTG